MTYDLETDWYTRDEEHDDLVKKFLKEENNMKCSRWVAMLVFVLVLVICVFVTSIPSFKNRIEVLERQIDNCTRCSSVEKLGTDYPNCPWCKGSGYWETTN